jgi:hypothetical protein
MLESMVRSTFIGRSYLLAGGAIRISGLNCASFLITRSVTARSSRPSSPDVADCVVEAIGSVVLEAFSRGLLLGSADDFP